MAEQQRVLIVSENAEIAEFLELEALHLGCAVRVLSTPPSDLTPYTVAIADLASGYCTAGDSDCRVITLQTGDYAVKEALTEALWTWPVSIGEIHEVLGTRTKTPKAEPSEPMVYVLSKEQRSVLYRNRQMELTDHEWRLLRCLGETPYVTVEREKLSESLGGAVGNEVDVYIHALRRKLEEPFGIRLIKTVRGKGYSLGARLCAVKK